MLATFAREGSGDNQARGRLLLYGDDVAKVSIGTISNTYFSGSGNVGIGTTAPSEELHVVGMIKVSEKVGHDNAHYVDHYYSTLPDSTNTGMRFSQYTATNRGFWFGDSNDTIPTLWVSPNQGSSGIRRVGINTFAPGYTLDVDGDIGYSGAILDYSLRRLKEDIVEVDGSGFIDKFKNIPLYRYRYKPQVDKDELKDLAFREFGIKIQDAVKWTEDDDIPDGALVGDIKEEEKWEWDKWNEIFPSGSAEGRMWDCPDVELKAFLDEQAEELRSERRTDYHQKHQLNLGLIADDEALAENFPEVLGYREFEEEGKDEEVWGIKTNAYIGMLHGVVKELVGRVEALEAQISGSK
jgi:hypothetical protein